MREASGKLMLHMEKCPQPSVPCCSCAVFQPPWKRAGSQSHRCVGLVQGGWEVLWPSWCPRLPSVVACARVRAVLQGAALGSKAGSRGGHGVRGSMEAAGVFGKAAVLVLW